MCRKWDLDRQGLVRVSRLSSEALTITMTTHSPVKTEPEPGPSTPQPSIASRIARYAFTPPTASSSRSPPKTRSRRIVEVVIEKPRRTGKRGQAGHANGETAIGTENDGEQDEPHTPRKRRRRTDHTPDLVKIELDTTPLRKAGSTKGTPKKSPKTPRPYAGPEVYAHLRHLPDHIKPGLSSGFLGRRDALAHVEDSRVLRYQVSFSLC